MITAILLVEAGRSAMSTLGDRLAATEGVTEVFSVTGHWDFVAIVRLPRHEQLSEMLAGPVADLEGITRLQTMVAIASHPGEGPAASGGAAG